MTLLDVVNRVKLFSHRGNQAVTTDQITSDILIAADVSYADLALKLPRQSFRQDGVAISTVAGTDIYSITGTSYPAQEYIAFHYLFQNVNYNLNKVESEQEFWHQVYSNNTPQMRPYCYVHWGFDGSGVKQIRLFPIPDAVYTINWSFYVDPTTVHLNTLALSTEVPFLPSYMQEALWKGALYYYLKSYDDQGQLIALQDYEKAKNMQDIAEDSAQDSNLQMRFDLGPIGEIDQATGIRLIRY